MDLLSQLERWLAPMGTFYVVCTMPPTAVADSLSPFEAWLGLTFPDARVVERGEGAHAVGWERGGGQGAGWFEGWLSEDREAIYLKGDLSLVCKTALALRDLFPSDSVVVLTGEMQGIPFNLREMTNAAMLAKAVEAGDESLAWKDQGPSTRP